MIAAMWVDLPLGSAHR